MRVHRPSPSGQSRPSHRRSRGTRRLLRSYEPPRAQARRTNAACAPVRIASQKSSSSRYMGSTTSTCGDRMSPVRYVSVNSPNVAGSRTMAPESNTRTGSLDVSSYTIIFREPTIVVRRNLLGASHDSSTCATVPEVYSRCDKRHIWHSRDDAAAREGADSRRRLVRASAEGWRSHVDPSPTPHSRPAGGCRGSHDSSI